MQEKEEKVVVYKEIIAVTEQIQKIRREIKFSNEIEKSIPMIKNETKELEEREKSKENWQ